MPHTTSITLSSPAKVNLVLLIEGLRSDGFHDLLSIVSPISLMDEVTIRLDAPGKPDSLNCEGITDDISFMADNYVLKATQLFRKQVHVPYSIHYFLKKNIPISAGLGGGSSNAVTALKGLNQLSGSPLMESQLYSLALILGSDCPFFLHPASALMQGRGEKITPLPPKYQNLLVGRRLLIFKPDFPISTPWAYSKIKDNAASCYQNKSETEEFYKRWLETLEKDNYIFLKNTFESVIFPKYLPIPELLGQLTARFNLQCGLSGSGSACFALLDAYQPIDEICQFIYNAWGISTPIHECSITN